MSMTTARDGPPEPVVRRMVELACLAPSVANSQPWSWQLAGSTATLYVDGDRRPPTEDPLGRNMVISCGTALHHFRLAARVLGWQAEAEQLPEPSDTTLMARASLRREPCHDAARILAALRTRSTDPRRFTTWPVPETQLDDLSHEARAWRAGATPLLDFTSRMRLELLVRSELSRDDTGVEVESSDGLIVLGGEADDPLAWLRTGEALSALWIRATEAGLSVLPLCRPMEVPAIRALLQMQVPGAFEPHLLVRVGWQPLGRRELVRTPRRPIDEVLRS